MSIILIAAMSSNRVIGKDNTIPWEIPGEQRRFREITTGHTIVMGRKTFESIGRPLPQRANIILTTNRQYRAPGCQVLHDCKQILTEATEKKVFVIGGQKIFECFLPYAEDIYLSILHETVEGDTFFPHFSGNDFKIVYEENVTASIPYTFTQYQKTGKGVSKIPLPCNSAYSDPML